MGTVKRTPEQIRDDMIAFCVREEKGIIEPRHAYIAALTSAAHLCDQVSREATRSAERKAAKDCGDFIWAVADAIKANHSHAAAAEPSNNGEGVNIK